MSEDQDLNPDNPDGELVELGMESLEVEDTEDGGAIIRLEDEEDLRANVEHFANLVNEVDPSELNTLVNDVLELIERDKEAREKRDKLYEEGLRRTGLGDDAPGGAQFSGANKVVHPMLVEACVDFSARVMKEIMPPNGPVKSKIVGEREHDKIERAERKAAFMNWQLTEQIREFRGELEQLSTQLPLGGGQYLKWSFNRAKRRPQCEFVPIDDIYLPFAATNFYSAERKTHVQYITKAKYRKMVRDGLYEDVDLPAPENPEFSAASKANDKIEGREETSYNEDGLRTIFEVQLETDIEDGEMSPYILTIDKSTRRALALYRNWDKDDEEREELEWIIEFPFVPWRGAYPIGLTHMIGGLSGAATGALRALLDSAHIQNIPTLLKLKGGPNGQTINVQPTQVAELDGGAIVDDIRKLVMPMPFPGPSATLFQLLGFLVDAGKGVVQTSFEKLSDQNPNAPVGTTVALIEQGMVVFSSIHARLHSAMGRSLKVLHRINSAFLTEEDIQRQAGDMEVTPADFDGPMDIVPVSDPNIFSETQRFAQVQAVMQRAAAMPQMYDARKVEEMFLHALKMEDDLLVPKPGEEDVDPVSENVAATMGQPVYVMPGQQHIAHLQTHMAFLQSPLFGQNPVIARTLLLPMVTHIRDHLISYYMTEAQKGVGLATKNGAIQGRPEEEVAIIMQVQQVIEQQLAPFAQILPQLDQAAQQFAPPQMPPDPSMAVAQLGAQTQKELANLRLQFDQFKLQQTQQTQIQRDAALLQDKERERQADLQRESLRQTEENRRTEQELAARVAMNNADNNTALQLAAAEIASGERVAVSTGTGINPGA